MPDETEEIRRQEQIDINAQAACHAELEARHGQVWDCDQLQQEFEVLGFLAQYCIDSCSASARHRRSSTSRFVVPFAARHRSDRAL